MRIVSREGRAVVMACRALLFMAPGPMMPSDFAFTGASFLAAAPGTAAVRYALSRLPDMIANGAPVSLSLSTMRWIERGSPCSRLSMLEPYHLTPAVSKRPPR